MAGFFELMRRSKEGGPNEDTYYRIAMICLVGLYDRQAEGGPADPERLRRFRKESGELLAALDGDISAYVQIAISLAQSANDNEWYELCMRRSVIQSLLDDYADTPVPELIDPVDLADLDTELRRVGKEQGPIPAEFVPKGLPGHHWWWSYLS